MADATHAYVVFAGGYTDHPEEHWQFGIRYFIQTNGSTPDTSGGLPPFGVDHVAVSRTEAHWNIESTWNADLGAPTFTVDDWLNDQLGPACDNFFGTGLSSKVRLDSIKVSPINTSGHVVDLRTSVLTWTASNPTGADTANMLPLETSIVVSWETPVIGRKGRGRIYLPPSSTASVDADGLVASAKVSAKVANMVSFLEATAVTAGIISAQWAIPIVTGAPYTQFGQIVGLNIGNVFDTQRRRRRQQVEVRSHAAVSY